MKPSTRALLPLVLVLSLAGGARAAAAGPMAQLRKAKDQLNRLAQRKASDARIRKFVNRLLDFDTMAERVLRKHWAGLSPEQRAQFKTLFRQLIEKNYVKGLRKNATYQVDYKREAITGKTAKVYTVVRYVRKGRARQTEVVYRMRRVGRTWKVFDLITEGESLERNYRKSFSRIIRRKGFDVLLQKMRKKLRSL